MLYPSTSLSLPSFVDVFPHNEKAIPCRSGRHDDTLSKILYNDDSGNWFFVFFLRSSSSSHTWGRKHVIIVYWSSKRLFADFWATWSIGSWIFLKLPRIQFYSNFKLIKNSTKFLFKALLKSFELIRVSSKNISLPLSNLNLRLWISLSSYTESFSETFHFK